MKENIWIFLFIIGLATSAYIGSSFSAEKESIEIKVPTEKKECVDWTKKQIAWLENMEKYCLQQAEYRRDANLVKWVELAIRLRENQINLILEQKRLYN